MGRPMAHNLASAGFQVLGWNRTPAKAPPGVAEKRSIEEVARDCQVVATMLADDAAVESAAHVLYERLPRGATHLGMSTISIALARRLAFEHAARGQRYVAAPVFGRPEAAEKKLLWIVTGGETDGLATTSTPRRSAATAAASPTPSSSRRDSRWCSASRT